MPGAGEDGFGEISRGSGLRIGRRENLRKFCGNRGIEGTVVVNRKRQKQKQAHEDAESRATSVIPGAFAQGAYGKTTWTMGGSAASIWWMGRKVLQRK